MHECAICEGLLHVPCGVINLNDETMCHNCLAQTTAIPCVNAQAVIAAIEVQSQKVMLMLKGKQPQLPQQQHLTRKRPKLPQQQLLVLFILMLNQPLYYFHLQLQHDLHKIKSEK
jgi:hypothetical protein